MYTISIHTTGVDNLLKKINDIGDKQKITLKLATSLKGEMVTRIHEKGLSSNGGSIGTYSTEYMKVRNGGFNNQVKITRGKNKGIGKESGVYTKGKNKGELRHNYNRGADRKVILSLTRFQENDLTVVAVDGGLYGVGYNNELNFKKSQGQEKMYNKKIFYPTSGEMEMMNNVVSNFIKDALS